MPTGCHHSYGSQQRADKTITTIRRAPLNRWGWTVGGGIEYALSNHWSALAEYDHIGVPSATVPFLSVAVINTQPIAVRQSVNLFKLGVNYKFELADLGAIVATP